MELSETKIIGLVHADKGCKGLQKIRFKNTFAPNFWRNGGTTCSVCICLFVNSWISAT